MNIGCKVKVLVDVIGDDYSVKNGEHGFVVEIDKKDAYPILVKFYDKTIAFKEEELQEVV